MQRPVQQVRAAVAAQGTDSVTKSQPHDPGGDQTDWHDPADHGRITEPHHACDCSADRSDARPHGIPRAYGKLAKGDGQQRQGWTTTQRTSKTSGQLRCASSLPTGYGARLVRVLQHTG